LAQAFQEMLERYKIEHKPLSFTGDSATSNDTQTTVLSTNPNNSFAAANRVRCFNHILNISAKSLLRPFQKTVRRDGSEVMYSLADFEAPELEDEDREGDEEDDKADDIDIFVEMSEEEQQLALQQMAAVQETISKVSCSLHVNIILLTLLIASQTVLYNHSFVDQTFACVAC
ncbi:hypothetical protein B0H10DRAFT_1840059, partial [Mycena sp. CBHHK59/15]